MAKFLVTGACGFIGSHLTARLLSQGHTVRALDDLSNGHRYNIPDSVPLEVVSVEDVSVVRTAMEGVDGCFHLAAIASVDISCTEWQKTHQVNLSGTINVFDAARGDGAADPVPVVYASSAAVYGDNPDMPLSEAARTVPLSAYGADKLGCEQHARVAAVIHSIPTIGFRIFNVFGPRQDPRSPYSGVISNFANRLNRRQGITVYGDGEQSRDFVYVDDVVDHLIAGLRLASTEAPVFNVCTGRSTTVNELINTLGRVLESEVQVAYEAARTGDIRVSLGDPSRAIAHLSCRAGTSLEDGLRETLEWMRTQDVG